MMSNNKILTVSYGTFSCTLEGFDDSFGTMKAIAEYFRDLASDDRYFGAEPAQPDAEMLTRIAEREISRRVEAREHEGRIVLSASGAQPAPALAGMATTAAHAQSADADAVTKVVTKEVASKAAIPDVDAPEVTDGAHAAEKAVESDNAGIADAIAAQDEAVKINTAKTMDAAEPVEDDASGIVDAVAASIDTDITKDVDTDDRAEAFFAASDEAKEDESADDLVIESVEDKDNAETDDQDAIVDQGALVAEAITAPAPAAADSIAAKLQRIRAVVSQSQQDAEKDELFEDEHAEDMEAENAPAADVSMDADNDDTNAVNVMADAARDIEDAARIDDDIQTAKADADEGDDDDIAAILARFDAADDGADDGYDAVDTVTDIAVDDVKDDAAQTDLGLDTIAALMAADDGVTEEGGENIFDDADTKDAPAAPRRARIVKVKRADIDAAIASGQLEEVEDEDEASSLSEQDEAELLAELAQVETELDDIDQTARPAAAESAKDEAAAQVKDDDVSRLMAEADNQMDEPEGSGRRNAFAHLKAAVAAKKADADIGNDSIKDEGAFRSDLASVVKPRRPEAGGTRAQRPDAGRPAPLKLVAEQRVDVDVAAKGPVRPRRIAAVEEVEAEVNADGTFADYAADMGAHNLPALLEAAASYLSFVEGRDQFSRPQLMNKVRQVEKDDFSREDGLRSFGQLLRAGKIEKMKGGRFAVTDDIGFRPDTRAAG